MDQPKNPSEVETLPQIALAGIGVGQATNDPPPFTRPCSAMIAEQNPSMSWIRSNDSGGWVKFEKWTSTLKIADLRFRVEVSPDLMNYHQWEPVKWNDVARLEAIGVPVYVHCRVSKAPEPKEWRLRAKPGGFVDPADRFRADRRDYPPDFTPSANQCYQAEVSVQRPEHPTDSIHLVDSRGIPTMGINPAQHCEVCGASGVTISGCECTDQDLIEMQKRKIAQLEAQLLFEQDQNRRLQKRVNDQTQWLDSIRKGLQELQAPFFKTQT